jgi:hypothetical protein
MAISKIRNRGTSSSTDNKYTESTTDDADDKEQFIDEDDQKDLVESLQSEANKQSIFFQNVFGYGIGGFATVFSLIFPLLCPDECANNNDNNNKATMCWLHAIYSTLTHAWVTYPFVVKKTSQTRRGGASKIRTITDFIGIALQLLPIVLWLTGFFIAVQQDDDPFFHLALIIGNVVTCIGAHLIYWDIQSTRKAIEELDSARYKHKAL